MRRHLATVIATGMVALAAAPTAVAADGQPLLLGNNWQTATNTTGLRTTVGHGLNASTSSSVPGYAGLLGYNTGGGDGVMGISQNQNGVFGLSNSNTASGVYGENKQGGFGVAGRASNGGVAVLADADATSVALRTTGKLQFQNRSGTTMVASGTKSKVVTLAGVTTASMVTATVQRTGGFFVQAAVPANGSFTIYLNKAPVAPATVKVAYLVLN